VARPDFAGIGGAEVTGLNIDIETVVIWVCTCCMLCEANGECCADDTHGGDSREPLSAIGPGDSITLGMGRDEHDEQCQTYTTHGAPASDYECDCENRSFSWSTCEGCGSHLGGERHAMTLWLGDREPA
jgi:hypothetical protein